MVGSDGEESSAEFLPRKERIECLKIKNEEERAEKLKKGKTEDAAAAEEGPEAVTLKHFYGEKATVGVAIEREEEGEQPADMASVVKRRREMAAKEKLLREAREKEEKKRYISLLPSQEKKALNP